MFPLHTLIVDGVLCGPFSPHAVFIVRCSCACDCSLCIAQAAVAVAAVVVVAVAAVVLAAVVLQVCCFKLGSLP